MSLLGEPVVLPFLAPDFKEGVHGSLSDPKSIGLLPAGAAFQSFQRRAQHNLTFEQDDENEAAFVAKTKASTAANSDDEDAIESEDESPALLNLDPKEWKKQDHYAVLGLSNLRYKATESQIKRAHRKKVLKHHPDKKASAAHNSNDDSFFKCIAKAFETLSHPVKRRQFDSIDQGVDDDDFPRKAFKTDADFFKHWAPVFEREGRFSNKLPVPALGDLSATKPEVEKFYDFWYNFDSWRSFEYEDDEINEGSDSRDEKRYRERKNRSERARKKKDDNTRLRTLVDLALSSDPRIKKFKQEEKAAREAKRKPKPAEAAKVDAAKKAEEDKAAKEAEAKKAQDDKAVRDAAKKAKEAAKKNIKKDKKAVSALVPALNYFEPAGTSVSAANIGGYLGELDVILDKLEPEEVAALKAETEKVKADAPAVKAAIASAGKAKGLDLKFFA